MWHWRYTIPYWIIDRHKKTSPNTAGYLYIEEAIASRWYDLKSHRWNVHRDDNTYTVAFTVNEAHVHLCYRIDSFVYEWIFFLKVVQTLKIAMLILFEL